MRRDREDELDLAHVRGEADAATHGGEDRIAIALAQASCWRSFLRTFREHKCTASSIRGPMFFTFPEDARWSAEHQAVEFGVEIGEYRGVVRVRRRVFQRLVPERPTPERWSRRTTSNGPGSRASPSESCDGAS